MSRPECASPRRGPGLSWSGVMQDKAAMHAFWSFYEPRAAAVSEAVTEALASLHAGPSAPEPIAPEPIAPEPAPEPAPERNERALQRLAILDDRWLPYLASLREQGVFAALSGHGYTAWYDRIKAFRGALREQLAAFLGA